MKGKQHVSSISKNQSSHKRPISHITNTAPAAVAAAAAAAAAADQSSSHHHHHHHHHHPENSWPIRLYRYIPSSGWERYQTAAAAAATATATAKTDEDHHNTTTLYATPKKNCVEIKKLRLRIHLFASTTMTGTSKMAVDTTANHGILKQNSGKEVTTKTATVDGETSITNTPIPTTPPTMTHHHHHHRHATVVQRQDTLLITSSRGNIGAIVLKFDSFMDCAAFTHQLVVLNSSSSSRTTDTVSTTIGRNSTTTTPLSVVDPMVQTYLIQMIHDPNFRQFVQYMDHLICCIPGGQDMLLNSSLLLSSSSLSSLNTTSTIPPTPTTGDATTTTTTKMMDQDR